MADSQPRRHGEGEWNLAMADSTGLENKHAGYEAMELIWQKLRDVTTGEEAVKGRDGGSVGGAQTRVVVGTEDGGVRNLRQVLTWDRAFVQDAYLPPLGGQDVDSYTRYLNRAEFYNASGRTVDGLVGAVMRKEPQVEPAETQPLDEWLDNIDLAGTDFNTFCAQVLREVVVTGRVGIFADYPASGPMQRPYLVMYKTEQITNWRTEVRDGQTVLAQVVLSECVSVPGEGGFGVAEQQRYRVLTLDDAGFLQVDVWTQDENNVWQLTETVQPQRRGVKLTYIPFVCLGPVQCTVEMQKSPILDLVNVNLHHYKLSADYRHMLHWSCIPQPVVIGDDPQTTYHWGSEEAWTLPSGATAEILECTGAASDAVKTALSDDENRMALLGARLLEAQKREAETAEAMRLRQAGESATLTTIAKTCSLGLQQALRWCIEWVGGDPEQVNVYLNTQFTAGRMAADDLLKYWTIVQGGGMSLDTFLALLVEDEIIAADEVESEKERIQMQGPIGLGQPGVRDPNAQDQGNGAGDGGPATEAKMMQ